MAVKDLDMGGCSLCGAMDKRAATGRGSGHARQQPGFGLPGLVFLPIEASWWWCRE